MNEPARQEILGGIMSKKILELLLQELKKVRIVCKGKRDGKPCGATFEIPMGSLKGFFPEDKCRCPFCGQSFYPEMEGLTFKNPFNPLAEAIEGLLAISGKATVTFVIEESENALQDVECDAD